jgi:Tfp pilus assembly protein PilN
VSQQINLFNPVFLKQKKRFNFVNMLQAVGILCALQLVLLAYGHYVLAKVEKDAADGKAALEQKQEELNRTLEQYKPRKSNPVLQAEIAQVEADIAALRRVETVLNQGSLGNTAGYSEYFRAFARQNVSGMWLTGVNIIGAGVDISVEGRAMQAALIPGYILRLTGEQVMNGKTFADLRIERPLQAPAPAVLSDAAPTAPAAPAAPAAAQFVEFRLQSKPFEAKK